MAEKVSIIVTLKDAVSKPAKGIKGAFSGIASKAKAFLGPQALMVAGFTALAAGALKVIGGLAELQTKMVNVGNLYGASRDEVNKLTDDLVKLSATLPQSVDNLADSLFDVVSAGVPAGESIKFLEVAGKLATAGVTDTKTAVDGLTSVMNAFSFEAADATMISDKFFAAQQKGKTTIAELSNSIGQVAPIAAGMGVSFDELIASMSTLTLNGIRTSEAATGLKATLSNLLKPSEAAATVSEALGIEFDANAVKSKGLANVLRDVIDKTGGSKQAMGQLFGSMEAVNAVLALSKNEFKALDDVMGSVEDSAGSTQKALDETLDTFNSQTKIAGNNLFAFGKIFLDWVIPATTSFLKVFNKVFGVVNSTLNKITGSYKKSYDVIEARNKQLQKDIIELEGKKLAWMKDSRLKILKAELDANNKKLEALKAAKEAEKTEENAGTDAYILNKQKEVEALLNSLEKRKKAEKEHQKELEKAEKERLKEVEKAKKDAADAEKKRLDDISGAYSNLYSQIGNTETVLDAFKAMGEGVKNFLKNQIIAWMGVESAKATMAGLAAAIPTLGASLLIAAGQVAGIAAAGAAAITGINSIKFKDGGIVPGNRIVGDTQTVRVNSGEMILNKAQQRNLSNQLFATANGSGGGGGSALIKEIRMLREEMAQPKQIKLDGNSFAKATFQTQQKLKRSGQISTKG